MNNNMMKMAILSRLGMELQKAINLDTRTYNILIENAKKKRIKLIDAQKEFMEYMVATGKFAPSITVTYKTDTAINARDITITVAADQIPMMRERIKDEWDKKYQPPVIDTEKLNKLATNYQEKFIAYARYINAYVSKQGRVQLPSLEEKEGRFRYLLEEKMVEPPKDGKLWREPTDTDNKPKNDCYKLWSEENIPGNNLHKNDISLLKQYKNELFNYAC